MDKYYIIILHDLKNNQTVPVYGPGGKMYIKEVSSSLTKTKLKALAINWLKDFLSWYPTAGQLDYPTAVVTKKEGARYRWVMRPFLLNGMHT